MPNKLTLPRLILAFFLCVQSSLAHSMNNDAQTLDQCGDSFARLRSFSSVVSKAKPLLSGRVGYGSEDLRYFLTKTLPFLKKIAADNDVSLGEFIDQYFEMYSPIAADATPGLEVTFGLLQTQFREASKQLENLRPGAKLKPRDYLNAKISIRTLGYLAMNLVMIEMLAGNDSPSVDPSKINDPAMLQKLFENYEYHSISTIINDYDKAKNEHLASSPLKQGPAPVDTVVVAQNAETLPTSFPTLEQKQAPKVIAVEPIYEVNFALAVRERLPLKAHHPYSYLNSRNEQYTVTLSDDITALLKTDQKDVIYKMLRSLLTGQSGASGLKALFDIGPKIVEVKAIFNGHKRLLGCIEGRSITLVELIDIKDNRSTYSRRIGGGYCI